jgi:hypothetical protein
MVGLSPIVHCNIGKSKIGVIFKKVTLYFRRWHLVNQCQKILSHYTPVAQFIAGVFQEIHVGIIAGVAVAYKKVFPAIVIIIGK